MPGCEPHSQNPRDSFKSWLQLVCCGVFMGAADIVPGISGGTIAFILGFYPALLDSIKSLNWTACKLLFQFKIKEFFQKIAWQFLSALLLGIALSFILLAHFFDFVLGHEIYRVYLYASFLGLISASVIFCAKQVSQWKPSHVLVLLVGVVTAFFLTGSDLAVTNTEKTYAVAIRADTFQTKKILNYDPETHLLHQVPHSTLSAMLAKGTLAQDTEVLDEETQRYVSLQSLEHHPSSGLNWWVVCCGSIAITAMLLPGISGSYLLTILGMYGLVIGALNDFINGLWNKNFDLDAFWILASMAIGILLGAVAFCRVIGWLLKRYHDISIALLTGFMIGALRSVWPFWTYAYVLNPLKLEKGPQLITQAPIMPNLDSSLFWNAVLLGILGFCLVLVVEYFAKEKAQGVSQARN